MERSARVDSESLAKTTAAFMGDLQRARAWPPPQPAQFETPHAERSAEHTREVRTALAPIQTGATEGPPAPRAVQPRGDAERGQERLARRRHRPAIRAKFHVPARHQRIGDPNAQAPGEVVVAGPRRPERRIRRADARRPGAAQRRRPA